jgi:hypothetical protein
MTLDNGRPIRRAVIRASSAELRDGRSVSTDAEGRWELREMPAGRFTLSVTKGGYVPLAYGQRRPFETGKTVEVAEGATVDKLDVALPRGGAVTGRVVDEFGEAVTGASVWHRARELGRGNRARHHPCRGRPGPCGPSIDGHDVCNGSVGQRAAHRHDVHQSRLDIRAERAVRPPYRPSQQRAGLAFESGPH